MLLYLRWCSRGFEIGKVVLQEYFIRWGCTARLLNPIGGDGLSQAMLSGKLAAETAVESIEYNDFGILKEYELRWRNDIYENNQYELYALKEMLLLMDVLVRAEVIEKLWSTGISAARRSIQDVKRDETPRYVVKLLKVVMSNGRLHRLVSGKITRDLRGLIKWHTKMY